MTVNDIPDGASADHCASHVVDEKKLKALFSAYGIAETYQNYSGETITVPLENTCRIVGLLDVDPSSETSVDAALKSINEILVSRWLPPAVVIACEEATHLELHFPIQEINTAIEWELETESGEWHGGNFLPVELVEQGSFEFDGTAISVRRLPIPALAVGYHKISLGNSVLSNSVLGNSVLGNSVIESSAQSLNVSSPAADIQQATRPITLVSDLIVAPPKCYTRSLVNESGIAKKTAGLSVQLYSLRSSDDWGIGDFGDLQLLIEKLAHSGVDFLVLNPLHLLDANYPENCSPYSPLDRRRLNPIYITPGLVPDFYQNERLQTTVKKAEFQQRIAALKLTEFVDYTAVTAIKYAVFSKMFSYFKKEHLDKDTDRAEQFRHYLSEQNESAVAFAAYQAQHCQLPYWHSRNPLFHSYLQWLAEGQLEACQQLALGSGFSIGLIRDLAVGSGPGSIEVATNDHLFCLGASIGAPPDPLAPQGQNWGLPPMKPMVLKETGYRHFIELLQTNMAHCGALRIDHVMALLRLWWCPGNAHNNQGVYVYYPVDELFAILRLESHRQQCVVIGEDLGVVPPQVREIMAQSGLLSNALFYFNKYDATIFKRPHDYPPTALTMVANHDVPTLTAWWNKTDLHKRREIGLISSDDEFSHFVRERESDLIQIFHWLNDSGLLPEEWKDFNIHREFDAILCAAILAGNGVSASQLVSIQLEDLCLAEAPVNIPGTNTEYPNWRRKLPLALDAMFSDATATGLLRAFVDARAR